MQFTKWSMSALATMLAAVSVVTANSEAAIADPDSAVVKLTAETFESFIAENPLVLAEFFAPWCGHCKTLGPNFAAAADELVNKPAKLAQIDCTEEAELCQQHEIRGYPTLLVFKGDATSSSPYQGGRTASDIVLAMTKLSQPAVSIIKSDDVEDFIADNTGAVVLQVGANTKPNNASFYEIADTLRDDFTFATVPTYGKHAKGTVLVFRQGDEEPSVFKAQKKLDADALKEFVKVESKPFFGELEAASFQAYVDAGVPLGVYFYEAPEQRDAAEKLFTELGKEYRSKVSFVGLDAAQYGKHAESLNAKQEFPLFVIHEVEADLKYIFPQSEELTEAEITKFVAEYAKGSIEPTIKSEDIPEVQEAAVVRLVGKTHNDIINDETKDVLVKYYAPWCGHCKTLAPIYEELAEAYVSDPDSNSKVTIANLDHTLNDVPGLLLKGYPTLILYPAGDKANPVTFGGQRSFEELSKFIKENGSNGVDAEAI
ncbi:hypothetical protein BABINDRAFT_15951, partial [Babjeviella inositovora NRRL Y-12698]